MRVGGWILVAAGIAAALWIAGGRRKKESTAAGTDDFIPRPTSLQTLQGCLVRIEELRRKRGSGAAA